MSSLFLATTPCGGIATADVLLWPSRLGSVGWLSVINIVFPLSLLLSLSLSLSGSPFPVSGPGPANTDGESPAHYVPKVSRQHVIRTRPLEF